MRRASLLLGLVFVVGCDAASGPGDLRVRVRSDLQPGYEFDRVHVRLVDAPTSSEREQMLLARTAEHPAYLSGRDVALYLDVTSAEALVEVELRAGADIIVRRSVLARIAAGAGSTTTVLLTRDCRGVSCPGSGDPAANTECHGGACVPRACSPERDGACPPPPCSRDSDCDDRGIECANGRCAEGRCLVAADESRCGLGERCSLDDGCVGAGLEPDGGP
ncbi:MAG: hypothetical protein KF729_03935 [Sandaracinaceae bacterium]|nr:hypothetical protein [Sandaracinaceae bacterium]